MRGAVAGASGHGDDHMRVERAQGLAVAQAVLERGPADRIRGAGNRRPARLSVRC